MTSKSRKKFTTQLPLTTEIEVIAIKGDEIHKKIMPYGQALELEKKPGFKYHFFQIGFSQFKTK